MVKRRIVILWADLEAPPSSHHWVLTEEEVLPPPPPPSGSEITVGVMVSGLKSMISDFEGPFQISSSPNQRFRAC